MKEKNENAFIRNTVFDYTDNKGIDIIAVVKMSLARYNAEVGYGAKLPSVGSPPTTNLRYRY